CDRRQRQMCIRDSFYSYRRSSRTGRFASLVWLQG
ncbi:hypothetical protein FA246_20680, partial [Pseudomonas aeruginosa]|nr:hypothetical protein [Pseudomonas aeruginosa]